MTRRKTQEKVKLEIQSNGIICLVGGFVVLLVPLPIFGHALRPLAWIFILLGIVLLAIPSFSAYMKKKLNKLESSKRAEPPS